MNGEDIALPALSDQRVDEIEAALFDRIARERRDAVADAERARVRAVRRGRVWMGAAAAAAFVAVAAVIAPQLTGVQSGSSGSTADQSVLLPAAVSPMSSLPQGATEGITEGITEGGAADSALKGVAAGDLAAAAASDGREIIATASATVSVGDAQAAADAVAAAADAAGGYVESMSLGGSRPVPVDAATGYPLSSGAWITVRVPADRLSATLDGLSGIGEVTATQVDRRDVTTEAVDLRARVGSLEASVTRLTELMGQATSTADLIAAESALAQRQSELDSLRQQLTWLDSQVGMSTLTVTLTPQVPAVSADPAGFGDGLGAGWNGLVAALNGLVIAIGFLLPWLGVLVVVGGLVWAVRWALTRRRAARQES